ncbi:MAG TPA: hypothetical protein VE973_00335, partial [Candidatus Limnocylindria bacterium]|nr:hypothetical protein [Candidatus Limnocylindria bacterium]
LRGLATVFAELQDGQSGLVVTHSPTLELALWAAGDFKPLMSKYEQLAEMAGVIIHFENGKIFPVATLAPPEAKNLPQLT